MDSTIRTLAEKLYSLSENGETYADSESVIELIEIALQELSESENVEDVVLMATLEMIANKEN